MPETLKKEMHILAQTLSQIEQALLMGKQVDLTGINEKVENICTRILTQDDATKKALEPDFSQLLSQISNIETFMRANFEKLLEQAQNSKKGG